MVTLRIILQKKILSKFFSLFLKIASNKSNQSILVLLIILEDIIKINTKVALNNWVVNAINRWIL